MSGKNMNMGNGSNQAVAERKKFNLNAFVLIFGVIVLCAISSFFVESGAFTREVVNGRTIIVPGSYQLVDKKVLSFFDVFRAIPQGLIGSSSIIFLVLIVGGAIEVFNKTGAISMGISKLVNGVGNKGRIYVLTLFMLIFAILGGFLGWIEAAIPFVPLVIPIILALGYDSMTAVAICTLGAMVGFSVGPTNVYTVGVAHAIAELPMFSGFGYRMLIYVVFVGISLGYTIWYGERARKNPEKSLVKGIDVSDIKYDFSGDKDKQMTLSQKIALLVLASTFVVVVYGMMQWKWNINDMSAAFLFSGILAGVICKMESSDIATNFINGAKGSIGGAMIVGIARGVQWILEASGIIDPVINSLSQILVNLPNWGSTLGIFGIVSLLNGLVPSGSGKAVALMPLVMPLADLVGITRQTAILAYQLGDGISNIFWFSYGTLLIFLAYGKVPLSKWYKFLLPLLGAFFVLTVVFLLIALKINYGPF